STLFPYTTLFRSCGDVSLHPRKRSESRRKGNAPVARLVFVALVAIAVAASGLLGYLIVEVFRGGENGAVIGQAQVGGPFELVDGEGRTVTDEEFRGEYMLVYFGYTYCPEGCPTELQNMSRRAELLGEEAEAVRPVFITVDPERDTPEVIESYVENFHPRMVG